MVGVSENWAPLHQLPLKHDNFIIATHGTPNDVEAPSVKSW